MFDDRLKNLRKSKGITSGKVASDLGLPPTTYSNYELDKREPTAMTLIKIARYFNVSIDYLCGYENEINAPPIKKEKPALTSRQHRIVELFEDLTEPQQDNIIGRAELFAEQNQEGTVKVFRVARSSDNHGPETVEISAEQLQKLKDAPATKKDL